MSGPHLICANITLEMIPHRQKVNQKRQKFPRFDKAFESSVHAHWPLISRLELWKQGGPTTMRLAQVGAVVSGMMRVVVNQSHFLEEEEKRKKRIPSVRNKHFVVSTTVTSKNILISKRLPFFLSHGYTFFLRLSFPTLLASHTGKRNSCHYCKLVPRPIRCVGHSPSTLICGWTRW